MGNLPLKKLFLAFLSLLLSLSVANIFLAKAEVESKVYIVYLGRKRHDDPTLITSSHHEMLSTVLGSKETSAEAMIYSYKHGFSGFAAKMTPSQAQKTAELPDVIHVIPNQFYKLHTTRSWDYLGLSFNSATNVLHDSKMGEDVIIGVIDTGLWPESQAFNDEGLGPIPSRWKGFCQAGTGFDPNKNCNRKLIGARYFIDGFLAESGIKKINISDFHDVLSARDVIGHGTHTASTASGSFVQNVSHQGLGYGTLKGGAPRSRLAMYKVAWIYGAVSYADILKAFDEAIHDGVDVLSLSLGVNIPLYSEVDLRDLISVGSFHAVEKGIIVVCAGGNSGPISQTVSNVAPWVITVAASTIDRSFPTFITLGNNQTLMAEALYSGKDTGFVKLAYPESPPILHRYCESLAQNDTWMAGKVVLCFTKLTSEQEILKVRTLVIMVGASGLIVAKNPVKMLDVYNDDSFPCVQVNFQTGTEIVYYIRSTRSPRARLESSRTYIGKPVSTYIASFSSRGPNTLAPAVLKPDVAAPGVNILAALPPDVDKVGYNFLSGTSMAAPHVAGITALLKSLHPKWTPAVIKSALVTTAWTTDPHTGEPIFAEGMATKLADPFDFGGGIVNPNRARDPGLIYNMGTIDYIHYLCSRGYDNFTISLITERAITCPETSISLLDLNFPSITIPSLKNSISVTRTVTNVGAANSTYKAIIEPPRGYIVKVRPDYLKFTPKIKTISFSVVVSTSHQATTEFYFGSLTWTDGVHKVRIPISVKTEIPKYDG